MDFILNKLILYYSNIWLGIGLALLYFSLLISLVYAANKKISIFTLTIGLIFAPFLAFQISRLYGALELKDTIESATSATSVMTYTDMISNEVKSSNFFSIFSLLPGVTDLSNWITDIISQGEIMITHAQEYIKNYIIRRCLWLGLFASLMALGTAFTFLQKEVSSRATFSNRTYGRSCRQERRIQRKRRQ